ncbi:MAG: hypothetical protein HC896_00140 [Bacteroidales bacterium]|nr:hypothetical protein [Bacteroidales bacterium]
MQTFISNLAFIKQNIAKTMQFKIVIQSFFYFFGLSQNPLHHVSAGYRHRSDVEAIRGDMQRIGSDFNIVFNEQTSETQPATKA